MTSTVYPCERCNVQHYAVDINGNGLCAKCARGIVTHADFKRALQTPGVKVKTLALAKGHELLGSGRLKVGDIRTVRKADTTGVYLIHEGDTGRGSFLGYDKARDWVFDGDIASNPSVGYAYQIIFP